MPKQTVADDAIHWFVSFSQAIQPISAWKIEVKYSLDCVVIMGTSKYLLQSVTDNMIHSKNIQ